MWAQNSRDKTQAAEHCSGTGQVPLSVRPSFARTTLLGADRFFSCCTELLEDLAAVLAGVYGVYLDHPVALLLSKRHTDRFVPSAA